jgi:hypothetical protein
MSEAALEDMRYTDGVIREAMRITPIIAGFPRLALQVREEGGRKATGGAREQIVAGLGLAWAGLQGCVPRVNGPQALPAPAAPTASAACVCAV